MFNTEPETSILSNNSDQSPAINESNQIKTTKDSAVKKGSLQKSVCDGLEELAKKKINKVRAQQKCSQDIQDLKVRKAKTELETAETTLEIVKTELALKKIEFNSKIRQIELQEDILNLQKQKLSKN